MFTGRDHKQNNTWHILWLKVALVILKFWMKSVWLKPFNITIPPQLGLTSIILSSSLYSCPTNFCFDVRLLLLHNNTITPKWNCIRSHACSLHVPVYLLTSCCSIAHAGHIRAATSSHWSQSLKDSVNSCISKYHRRNRSWAPMFAIWMEYTSGKEEREEDCGIRTFFHHRVSITCSCLRVQHPDSSALRNRESEKLKLYISSSLSGLWECSNIKQASKKKKKSTYLTIKRQRLRKPKRFSMGSNRN